MVETAGIRNRKCEKDKGVEHRENPRLGWEWQRRKGQAGVIPDNPQTTSFRARNGRNPRAPWNGSPPPRDFPVGMLDLNSCTGQGSLSLLLQDETWVMAKKIPSGIGKSPHLSRSCRNLLLGWLPILQDQRGHSWTFPSGSQTNPVCRARGMGPPGSDPTPPNGGSEREFSFWGIGQGLVWFGRRWGWGRGAGDGDGEQERGWGAGCRTPHSIPGPAPPLPPVEPGQPHVSGAHPSLSHRL